MSTPTNNPYETPAAPSSVVPARDQLEKVRSVAKAQRLVNIAILLYLLLVFASFATPPLDPNSMLPLFLLLVILSMLGFIIFAVARMGYSMHGVGHAILYSVAMLIPCLGIILLLILNSRVTNFLTRNGVKVGIMGADPKTIP